MSSVERKKLKHLHGKPEKFKRDQKGCLSYANDVLDEVGTKFQNRNVS